MTSFADQFAIKNEIKMKLKINYNKNSSQFIMKKNSGQSAVSIENLPLVKYMGFPRFLEFFLGAVCAVLPINLLLNSNLNVNLF